MNKLFKFRGRNGSNKLFHSVYLLLLLTILCSTFLLYAGYLIGIQHYPIQLQTCDTASKILPHAVYGSDSNWMLSGQVNAAHTCSRDLKSQVINKLYNRSYSHSALKFFSQRFDTSVSGLHLKFITLLAILRNF